MSCPVAHTLLNRLRTTLCFGPASSTGVVDSPWHGRIHRVMRKAARAKWAVQLIAFPKGDRFGAREARDAFGDISMTLGRRGARSLGLDGDSR